MKWFIRYNTLKLKYDCLVKNTKNRLYDKVLKIDDVQRENAYLRKHNKQLRLKIKEMKSKRYDPEREYRKSDKNDKN